MQVHHKNLRAIAVGLILAIMLDTVLQMIWKCAVNGIPENASVAAATGQVLSGPYFYLALIFFAAQFFNWIHVLAHADLSFAQPFTALSYITVLALSGHFFHEKIASMKILGVVMIFLGVLFISQTPHRTTNPVNTR